MLLSEVVKIAKLIRVMPATNAVSERSFSTLRNIKSYLRSTITEVRLNSAMILNIHKEKTDELNLIDVANEFFGGSDFRQSIFGKFIMNGILNTSFYSLIYKHKSTISILKHNNN